MGFWLKSMDNFKIILCVIVYSLTFIGVAGCNSTPDDKKAGWHNIDEVTGNKD